VTRPGTKRLDDIIGVADEVASTVARGKNIARAISRYVGVGTDHLGPGQQPSR
jgi:hypothetical protein